MAPHTMDAGDDVDDGFDGVVFDKGDSDNNDSLESEEVEVADNNAAAASTAAATATSVAAGNSSCFAAAIPHPDAVDLNTFLQRESKRIARNPCLYLWTSVIVTLYSY